MRSRPLVKVRTSAAVLEPGMPFEVEIELVSRSETPTDSVAVRFDASELSVYGAGKGARVHSRIWESQAASWTPGKLGVGSVKQRFSFHVPEGAPPTYEGVRCRIEYRLHVTVDIPWWVDREASFVLPVAPAATPLRPASPLIVATSSEGPRPGQLYIEASIDATELAPGDVLTGVVSFANVSAKRIRAIRIGFVSSEHVKLPASQVEDAMVYATTLLSGPPPEEEPVPFRIVLPKGVTPSFSSRPFSFRWRFEIRADIALGTDEVLSVPLEVRRPPPNVPRAPRPGRTWSVGRDRLRAVWQQVAARVAMELDSAGTSLRAARGPVSLVMHREALDGRLGVVARFAWPHLGLDLRLVERSWTHVFASGAVRLSNPAADPRFAAFGREAAQCGPFLDPEMLQLMLSAGSVKLDDDGAAFGVPTGATTAPALEGVANTCLRLAELFAAACERVPPPASVAANVDAWRGYAASVGGRLELGRMWIHDANLEGERFELGSTWEPSGEFHGTVVRFPIEPPLEQELRVEDPALSPLARELLRGLVGLPGFHATTQEIGFLLPDRVPDPATLHPQVESLAKLLRSKRGLLVAGPFR